MTLPYSGIGTWESQLIPRTNKSSLELSVDLCPVNSNLRTSSLNSLEVKHLLFDYISRILAQSYEYLNPPSWGLPDMAKIKYIKSS